jgi:hypothetical protein
MNIPRGFPRGYITTKKEEQVKTDKESLSRYFKCYNTITTALGGIVNGKIEFCGYDVTNDLAENFTQTEAFLLWALGRKPAAMETRLIDTLICLNIYPDIRIWSIRVGAYAAACGSPLSSCAGAAHVAANSKLFAVAASLACKRFFEKLLRESRDTPLEHLIEEYINKRVFFPGFGRPLIQGPDERYLKLCGMLKEWDYPLGRYTRLLFKTAPLIQEYKKIYPNYAALFVTLVMDEPFCFDDGKIAIMAHYMISLPSYLPAYEIREKKQGSPLLPLKVSDIIYTGKAKRN